FKRSGPTTRRCDQNHDPTPIISEQTVRRIRILFEERTPGEPDEHQAPPQIGNPQRAFKVKNSSTLEYHPQMLGGGFDVMKDQNTVVWATEPPIREHGPVCL